MIIKCPKSFIRVNEKLVIPECLTLELTKQHVYDFCLDIWSKDHGNIAKVSVDSIFIQKIPAKKTWYESDLHAILKHSAAKWLMNRGHKNIEFEKGCDCGIADVLCRESRVVVECGNIDVDGVLHDIKIGWTAICLPYHFFNDEEYESFYPMLIFHKDRGRKLDSMFKRMSEKAIDRYYAGMLRDRRNQLKRDHRETLGID